MRKILYLGVFDDLKSCLGLEALTNIKDLEIFVIAYFKKKSFLRKVLVKVLEGKQYQAELNLKDICENNGIKYIITNHSNLEVYSSVFKEFNPNIIFSNGWSFRIKSNILRIATCVSLNCHSSFLPFYKGGNATYAPLINQETFSGVSIHIMDEGIDTGPILCRKKVPIFKSDTPATLMRRRAEITPELISEVFLREKITSDLIENPATKPYYRCNHLTYRKFLLLNFLRSFVGKPPLKYEAGRK